MDCDAAALQAVRLQVYQRSAIKDIRSVNRDGSVICSAYSETLEFDSARVDRTDMLAAPGRGLLLFRLDQINGFALGVLRDIDDKKSLVAILGIDSYVFDIMPADLRQHSAVTLELTSGLNVGRFAAFISDTEDANRFGFSKTSERFPLRATIRVNGEALGNWNREPYWPTLIIAIALGLMFGLLLAKTIARPAGPVADLDRALLRGEFRPFYQPIFNLKTGSMLGCEVLARWVKPDGSIIPPLSFIPLAESSGRIEAMTWQILTTALSELSPRLRADKAFMVSVNIVPRHLLSESFVDTLRRLVAEARVSPRQIILELTERNELPDLKKAASRVRELQERGFRIALDDVGVGHSGLSQIKALGADTMKIDKFFVDTITSGDSSAAAIVEMLVRLARELKMTVVAEGIETSEQLAALSACGVEQGQGYLVSPPLPLEKFDALLEKRAIEREIAATACQAALVA